MVSNPRVRGLLRFYGAPRVLLAMVEVGDDLDRVAEHLLREHLRDGAIVHTPSGATTYTTTADQRGVWA